MAVEVVANPIVGGRGFCKQGRNGRLFVIRVVLKAVL